jgi:hypothetical protein
MRGPVAIVGLGWLGLLGCFGGVRLAGVDEDAPDGATDDSRADEGTAEDDAVEPEDAAPEDALPPGPEGCPATIAAPEGPAPVVRWVRRVESVWVDPGSAGLAAAQNTVVVGLPTGSWSGDGVPQPFRFFDGATGAELADPTEGEHHDWFAWCWAVAGTRIDRFVHFACLRWAGGVPVVEGATFDPRDGESGGGGWLFATLGVDLRGVLDLRSAPAGSIPGPSLQAFDVVRGTAPSGAPLTFAWLEGETALPGWDLGEGAPGEPLRAWSAPGGWLSYEMRDDLEIAVSTPTTLHLRTLAGREVAAVELRARSAWVPLVATDPAAGRSDFLLAGRSDEPAAGVGVWTELRRAGDLAPLAAADLGALDGSVVRPEPRDLTGADGRFHLVWATPGRRTAGAGDACLYVTPLDASGARAGGAVRINDPVPLDGPPLEQLRTAHDAGSTYLLWRRGTDLWVARVD